MRRLWRWLTAYEYRVALRDMEVRHAKERAAYTEWEIEVRHYLQEHGL